MADIPACGAPHAGIQVFHAAAGAQPVCWQVQKSRPVLLASNDGALSSFDGWANTLLLCSIAWQAAPL